MSNRFDWKALEKIANKFTCPCEGGFPESCLEHNQEAGVDDGKPRQNTDYGIVVDDGVLIYESERTKAASTLETLVGVAKKFSRCKQCGTPLICPSCAASKRGMVKSKAKSKAARANGKLGGRPRKEPKP